MKYLLCVFTLLLAAPSTQALSWNPFKKKQIPTKQESLFVSKKSAVKLTQLAGLKIIQEDLARVIRFMTTSKEERCGVSLGSVLIVGGAQSGKSLVAEALAGEADLPLFHIDGRGFVEKHQTASKTRIHDLFVEAKKQAPCIVCIDDLDILGYSRTGSNREYENVLNQLLEELATIAEKDLSIYCVATTSRPQSIHAELLKDRVNRINIEISLPYLNPSARAAILQKLLQPFTVDSAVDISRLAYRTSGFCAGYLVSMIRQTVLLAVSAGRSTLTLADFEEAIDTIYYGPKINLPMSLDEKKNTAYHEAGHALAMLLLAQDSKPFYKITIIPRSAYLGVAFWLPEYKLSSTNKDMMNSIIIALAGRAAQELVFGIVDSGASTDFQMATDIARDMVCHYGMSKEFGPVVYNRDHTEFSYSDATAFRIDQEISSIMNDANKKTMQLLIDNRDKLEIIAQALLEKETLYASDVYTLLGMQAPEIPALI